MVRDAKENYTEIAKIFRSGIENDSEAEINIESEMESANGFRIGFTTIKKINAGSFLTSDSLTGKQTVNHCGLDEIIGRTFAAFIG